MCLTVRPLAMHYKMWGSCFSEITKNFGERCRAVGLSQSLWKVHCMPVTLKNLRFRWPHQHASTNSGIVILTLEAAVVCTASLSFPGFSVYQCPVSIKKPRVVVKEIFMKVLLHWKKSMTNPSQLVYIPIHPWPYHRQKEYKKNY